MEKAKNIILVLLGIVVFGTFAIHAGTRNVDGELDTDATHSRFGPMIWTYGNYAYSWFFNTSDADAGNILCDFYSDVNGSMSLVDQTSLAPDETYDSNDSGTVGSHIVHNYQAQMTALHDYHYGYSHRTGSYTIFAHTP